MTTSSRVDVEEAIRVFGANLGQCLCQERNLLLGNRRITSRDDLNLLLEKVQDLVDAMERAKSRGEHVWASPQ